MNQELASQRPGDGARQTRRRRATRDAGGEADTQWQATLAAQLLVDVERGRRGKLIAERGEAVRGEAAAHCQDRLFGLREGEASWVEAPPELGEDAIGFAIGIATDGGADGWNEPFVNSPDRERL